MAKLTQERANKITEFFNSDREHAQNIFALGLDEAMTKINDGLGLDFSKDEILEYEAILKKSVLSDDELLGVAGGQHDSECFICFTGA
ncbi:MAG: hypothetical protein FWE05_11545 [Defluviitaleaceae bacterium]|nr:hypothetical protein [Defluviitaleaceae bacterium]